MNILLQKRCIPLNHVVHGILVSVLASHVKRGLPLLVRVVDVCAVINKVLDQLHMAVGAQPVQCSQSIVVLHMHIGTVLSQPLHALSKHFKVFLFLFY